MRNIALVFFLSMGCGSPNVESTGRDTLRIAGSHTIIEKLLPPLTSTHKRTRDSMDFDLNAVGSRNGIRMMLAGETDLAATTLPITAADREQAAAFSFDLDKGLNIAAVDVIAVAVHGSNPLESLTYDQIIGIFCTMEIDNWSFLGMENAPIRTLVRNPDSGTRALFEDFFCGARGIHRRAEIGSAKEIEQALFDDATVISFISLSQRAGKALALRPEAQARPISPSKKNIIRGAYPLAQDLTLYSRGPAKGMAQKFLKWIGSPAGQDVVDEADFVPLYLRPELMDEPRPLRETVNFDLGSSQPTARSIARIGLLIDELKGRAGEHNHIVLEGFTDTQEENPIELSQKRAEKVRDILSEALTGRFFELIPRGSAHPIAPNETQFGRQRNRRVQIFLADEEREDPAAETVVPETE